MNARVRSVLPVVIAVIGVCLVVSACARKANLIPDDYRSWKRTVEGVLTYPIPGHEENFRTIFINPAGENVSIATGTDGVAVHSYPRGTIIVKEVFDGKTYSDGVAPMMLTCMVKDPANAMARGGWLWIMKNPASGEETILDRSFCITCHANANEPHPYGDRNPDGELRDHVFFPFVPASP